MGALWGYLYNLDLSFFYLINHAGKNAPFDFIMPIITDISYFKVPIAVGFIALIIWGGRKGRTVAILAIPLLILSEGSAQAIKAFIQRVRPCHVLEQVHLLVGCSGSYSFPSGHATNIFAAALFLSRHYQNITIPLYALAFLVGYSRVYVGVHYPLDVIAGTGLGIAWASVVLYLEKEAIPRIYPGFHCPY